MSYFAQVFAHSPLKDLLVRTGFAEVLAAVLRLLACRVALTWGLPVIKTTPVDTGIGNHQTTVRLEPGGFGAGVADIVAAVFQVIAVAVALAGRVLIIDATLVRARERVGEVTVVRTAVRGLAFLTSAISADGLRRCVGLGAGARAKYAVGVGP